MGYEEQKERIAAEVGRPIVHRVFESMVSDITGLLAKFALRSIDEGGLILGLELLLPRLRRFAPGGIASEISQRCEQVLLNALTEGECADEGGKCTIRYPDDENMND